MITLGKFSVTDIFDNNTYAHDPKGDFLNWAIVDAGAYDYAADAWAYTYGGAAEWSFGNWTLRGGFFDMSRLPNSTELETDFSQYELVSELERRVTLFGHDGKIKLLGFVNNANMGSFTDALALARATGTTPDVARVRRYRARPGGSLNVEQGLTDDLGFFLRASENDGSKESFEFTDINESLSAGLSLKGTSWERKDDTVGAAFVVDGISKDFQAYLAAGGLGVLVGDGQLPHYSSEVVLETYYDVQLIKGVECGAGLSVHRQSRLQSRPRSGIGAGLPPARRVLAITRRGVIVRQVGAQLQPRGFGIRQVLRIGQGRNGDALAQIQALERGIDQFVHIHDAFGRNARIQIHARALPDFGAHGAGTDRLDGDAILVQLFGQRL